MSRANSRQRPSASSVSGTKLRRPAHRLRLPHGELILRAAALRDPVLDALNVPVLRCGAELLPRTADERETVTGLAENARTAVGPDVPWWQRTARHHGLLSATSDTTS